MPLHTLQFVIQGYLGPNFTDDDRQDLRTYAIGELKRLGVTVDPFATLPQILALVDVLMAERQSAKAA